jgi:hypothetical protein
MKKIVAVLFVLIALVGCNKESLRGPDTGIYRGVYLRIDNGVDTMVSGIANLAIFVDNQTFTLVPEEGSSAPISCNGRYFVIGNDSLKFINDAPISEFFYDDLLILDTTFGFTFSPEEFRMRFLLNDTSLYEYILESK